MKYLTPIIAIVCVTIIEVVALVNGFDGALLGLSMTVIGGICGYEIKKIRG
jgi:hypothetical protein